LIPERSGFLGKPFTAEGIEQQQSIYTLGRTTLTISKKYTPWNSIKGFSKPPNENFNQVVHIAGKTDIVPRIGKEKSWFFKVNVNGTTRLLESLEKLSERPKQFVFISTIAVYGLDTRELIKEKHPTNANTSYGKSKLLGFIKHIFNMKKQIIVNDSFVKIY